MSGVRAADLAAGPQAFVPFALVALLGGLAVATGNDALVATAAAFVGAIAVISYAFAPRNQLHRLVRDVMSEQELQDLLLFTAAVLVVFPLLPDRAIGPFDGLNPRSVWRLVVMAAGGAGYVALRLLGPRLGLPLTGCHLGRTGKSLAKEAPSALGRWRGGSRVRRFGEERMLNLHVAAASAIRTLHRVRYGVVVSVWPDGSITEHEPDDARRHARGVPLLSLTRASELPTYENLKSRLKAAAALRGLEARED